MVWINRVQPKTPNVLAGGCHIESGKTGLREHHIGCRETRKHLLITSFGAWCLYRQLTIPHLTHTVTVLALDILSCLKLEVCVTARYKNGQVAQDFASNSTIPLVETKLTLYSDSDDSRHLESQLNLLFFFAFCITAVH